jgi:hypothetical protein
VKFIGLCSFEEPGRIGRFVVVVDARTPATAVVEMRSMIGIAQALPGSPFTTIDRIYLDTIATMNGTGLIAFESSPEPPVQSQVCCGQILGEVPVYGWGEGEDHNGTIEPFWTKEHGFAQDSP